ncbi:unnamed protein product [Rotaria sp. Silwood2]|nr:unnamed protein product [Rotaria sp. Silwood2]CAF2524908.1 unnamed protein product [Rotaria sp. Silwood2]CAF2772764.1 unnamed protein product [Rotaria sp. Silwood2]CAF2947716.1 unnamed protein product [Rotaria sp. Silwood2]
MAEQCLSNSTDNPSILHLIKESTPLETTRHVNSLIRRSLSNKLNVLAVTPSTTMTTTSTSSTGSLAMTCTEISSVVCCIRRHQSITNATGTITTTSTDDGHVFNDDAKRKESFIDADKCASLNASDDDSFDDEDEAIVAESLFSSLSSTISNYVPMYCPICLEPASLQSTSCCTFHSCNSCWRAHISAALNDGRIKISCPSNGCNKYLTRESIVNFIRNDSPLHERYLKLYTNANQNPRAKTCPRCSHLYSLDTITSVQLKKNKKIPKQVQCSECLLVWCFRCSAPWHENLTCKQFIKGDKLLLKWINQKSEDQWNARKCCPHMTCSSCSCEFCYLCGRRYVKIPVIGQHNNKFSMFGCPYNLHPEKPWLRRTIRGMIATGVVVASPLLAVGAVTAAVVVLPPVGIYKLVKHIRSRRSSQAVNGFLTSQHILFNQDNEQQQQHPLFQFDLAGEDFNPEEIMRILRERFARLNNTQVNDENINEEFPLSIFSDMDAENLFSEDDKPQSGFRTCPTTPSINIRKIHSQSLNHLPTMNSLTINRSHSITLEH